MPEESNFGGCTCKDDIIGWIGSKYACLYMLTSLHHKVIVRSHKHTLKGLCWYAMCDL